MNRNDLFEAMAFIDETIIENSEASRTVKLQGRFTKRTLLLAAVLCLLIAFATVAVAARLISLRNALVETNDPEIGNEMSLSGFTGSSEYMAAAEWKAFADSYDPDGVLLAQADPEGPEDAGLDEKYAHYNVYTQEMAAKLEDIAAKYGLRLYSTSGAGDLNALAEKLIVSDRAAFSGKACNTLLDGYGFSDGTFSFDGLFDAASARLSVYYQFRCSPKGVFDPVFLSIGDIGDYQEQMLITPSGVELAAALSGEQAVLITEVDSRFITINVLGGHDTGLTFDDLADLANTFDFSVIASVPGLPALEPMETANAEANDEQQYIAVSREGITDQIPVETICILNTGATIAIAPEYFTHNVRDDVDVFTCEAWTGEREAYYSVYYIGQSCPNDLCEELVASYSDKYASRNVLAVKIGPYDATAVLFDGETASPAYQRHFFIVPAVAGCIVIEAQFDIEMYEGLYQIMLALFDTLEIG